MDEIRPRKEENPSPPEDSIQPLPNETVEEYSLRIDRMLKDWRANHD